MKSSTKDQVNGTFHQLEGKVKELAGKAAIFDEATLKTLQINVKTNQGVVQLSGAVDSAHSVRKAGEVAGSVNGVVSVENNLVIK